MLSLVGPRPPGVQPHPHLRYPARPVSFSSLPSLFSVFTDCSPAWRAGEFLFDSHTAQSSPNVADLHPHCQPTLSFVTLQLPQHTQDSHPPHCSTALGLVPDASPGQPPTGIEPLRLWL